jgi:hypothetical protein
MAVRIEYVNQASSRGTKKRSAKEVEPEGMGSINVKCCTEDAKL